MSLHLKTNQLPLFVGLRRAELVEELAELGVVPHSFLHRRDLLDLLFGQLQFALHVFATQHEGRIAVETATTKTTATSTGPLSERGLRNGLHTSHKQDAHQTKLGETHRNHLQEVLAPMWHRREKQHNRLNNEQRQPVKVL